MKRFTLLFVTILIILGSCKNDESIDRPIDPPQSTPDHSWAPLNRTTSNINLVEEDIISVETNSLELDFGSYNNSAMLDG